MAPLDGRTALVTGAASPIGIGFACARMLALRGAAVTLADIDGAAAAARAAELTADGLVARAVVHDVRGEASWHAALGAMAGGIDILVNNAGIAILKPLAALSRDEFARLSETNLLGTFLGCKLGLAAMQTQGRGGAIVNIGSVAALIGMPGTTAYGATKGGIDALTRSIAIEGAAARVRCNAVHPGAILTEIQKAALEDVSQDFGAVAAGIPLGRIGAPSDVAGVVAFLAGPDAGYVTGAALVVDGGLCAI